MRHRNVYNCFPSQAVDTSYPERQPCQEILTAVNQQLLCLSAEENRKDNGNVINKKHVKGNILLITGGTPLTTDKRRKKHYRICHATLDRLKNF